MTWRKNDLNIFQPVSTTWSSEQRFFCFADAPWYGLFTYVFGGTWLHGFKYVLFSHLLGEDYQFDSYFSIGLVQPPTRKGFAYFASKNGHIDFSEVQVRNCPTWIFGHIIKRGPMWHYGIPLIFLVDYCWWKKSCTSWYGKYPIIYRDFYIPGGAWFQPSTVWPNIRCCQGLEFFANNWGFF